MAVVQSLNDFVAWCQRAEAVFRAPMTPVLKVVAVVIGSELRQNFDRGVDPDGIPWKPLGGPRLRGGSKPLLDRGVLRAATTSQVQGHVEIYTGNTLVYGCDLPQAATHQYGATIRPRRGRFLAIPASIRGLNAGSPRSIGVPLVTVINKAGTGGVMGERGPRGQGRLGVVHFWLTKEVVIPARRFLGIGRVLLGKIADATSDVFIRVFQRL